MVEHVLSGVRGGNFGAGSSIATAAAPVTLEEALTIAEAEYGIRAQARRLVGERDQNYRLREDGGREFALKLIHPAEEREVTNFQTAVLLRIASSDPSLPVQRVVPTLDGSPEREVLLRDGSRRMMRLTTFLPGAIVRGLAPSAERSRRLGRVLAGVQLALTDFAHPADAHETVWDIRHTLEQRAVVCEIGDAHRRGLMEQGLERFESRVLPVMGRLRAQVVHNDLSSDNVVVDTTDHDVITGVLDFGDATRTAVANDVAVALAYALIDAEDVLSPGLPLVGGFHSVKPLLPEELDLMLELVIARMVVRVGITEWRARRFPENRDYILRSTPTTWRLLEALLHLSPDRARSAFHQACDEE